MPDCGTNFRFSRQTGHYPRSIKILPRSANHFRDGSNVPLDIQSARELVESRIRRLEAECGLPLLINDELTFTFEDGWIFFWNVAFPDDSDPIAGNAPIVVFNNGLIRSAPTAFAEPTTRHPASLAAHDS